MEIFVDSTTRWFLWWALRYSVTVTHRRPPLRTFHHCPTVTVRYRMLALPAFYKTFNICMDSIWCEIIFYMKIIYLTVVLRVVWIWFKFQRPSKRVKIMWKKIFSVIFTKCDVFFSLTFESNFPQMVTPVLNFFYDD